MHGCCLFLQFPMFGGTPIGRGGGSKMNEGPWLGESPLQPIRRFYLAILGPQSIGLVEVQPPSSGDP